ncbi:MAG: NB-ARC domain-containing protein [Cyanobacteria bacterium P01_D01_bin.6]
MSKRQRGVVLTDRGLERIEIAIAAAQEAAHRDKRFPKEEIAARAQTTTKTLNKIFERVLGVDKSKLRDLFQAFGLGLDTADYGPPDPVTAIAPYPKNSLPSSQPATKIDWGEKPDTKMFFGRAEELATLRDWVMIEQCRVVTLLGMGGIGKTSLAAKLADQIYDRFDYVIWRSLREAPPLEEILVRLIQFLSDQQETEINLPARLGERLIRLLHYLRKHRCLLVLDNLESILQAESTGQFRDGYADYGELIQHIGSTEHQSCLVLTSRECPRELAPMAGDRLPVRLWSVTGIDPAAGREILQTKGLELDEANPQSQELIDRYSGNPQALHLVATAIQREFLGDVDDFLAEEGAAVEDVRTLLDQHLTRLAPLERSILFWLAINREPVGLDELMEDLLPPVTKREVRSALRGLSDRYLIESVGKQFTLQNVIMEFASDRFVERVVQELNTQHFNLFHTHALIKATAKNYVRETQIRLILKPIAVCITNLEEQVTESLQTIRRNSEWSEGYTAGNLLNLLCQLQNAVSNLDFSKFILRQVHLESVALHRLSLVDSYFNKATISSTFGKVQAVALSPNDKIVAFGDRNGDIHLWKIKERQKIVTFAEHNHSIHCLAFSSDGQLLASSSGDATVRLWDIQKLQCLHIFREYSNNVWQIAFSFDNQLLASGNSDGRICLWDIQKRQCLHTFSDHTERVRSIAFSSDGQFLVSGSCDTTVRLWDMQERKCLTILRGHSNSVLSVAFSPDCRLIASGGKDTAIRLWDIQQNQCLHVFSDHTGDVQSLAFSPDSQNLISCSDDTSIRLWDIQKRHCLHIFSGHTHEVKSIALSSDGQLLVSGSEDITVRLWNVLKRQCLDMFSGYTDGVWSVAFSPDGQLLASGGNDNKIRLWDVQSCQCLHVFSGHTRWVKFVAFSPNGRMLVSSSGDTTIRLWDVQKRHCLHVFSGHTDNVSATAFSTDGQFLASNSSDATIRLWSVQKRQCLKILTGHEIRFGAVALSSDTPLLATGSRDNMILLWDMRQYQCFRKLEGHTRNIRSLAFSPDGRLLASGSIDTTIRLWDMRNFQCLHLFEDHTNWVASIAFSPDGQFLASSSEDKTVRLWDVHHRQCLRILTGHTNWIWSVAFSPDGQRLASASHDGTIRLWDVQTGNCSAVLQAPRPYEDTDITGVQGLTEAQRASMIALGAVDHSSGSAEGEVGSYHLS